MDNFRMIIEMLCFIFMGILFGMLIGQKIEEKHSGKRIDWSHEHAKEVLNYAVDSNKQWQITFEKTNREWLEKYTSLHNEYTELKERCAKNCGGCPKVVMDENR